VLLRAAAAEGVAALAAFPPASSTRGAATLTNTEVTPGAAGSAGEGAGDANDGTAGLAAAGLEI
jgi:hypothetical protein